MDVLRSISFVYLHFILARSCNSLLLSLMTIDLTPPLAPSVPFPTPVHPTVEALALPSETLRFPTCVIASRRTKTRPQKSYTMYFSFTALEHKKMVLRLPIRRVFLHKNDEKGRWLSQRNFDYISEEERLSLWS